MARDLPGNANTLPTPFVWQDPASLPPRPWLYGHHLLRGQVSVTVAPGGVGKSSLTICEALAMASGRRILGDWTATGLRVWIFNLEDPRDELQRRIIAAMAYHRIDRSEVEGRLFVDSGREWPLCMAEQTRNGARLIRPMFEALAEQIHDRRIDVLIVDPFVSSHRLDENDNGAIDMVAKEWARLAGGCGCAIELVHHTRKTNGNEASTEDARGATALLGAARSGRVLNRMTDAMKADAGLGDDPSTYFAVDRDKANLAPAGKRVWRRMASYLLPNGDSVGVAEVWDYPDAFKGVTTADLLRVQHALEGKQLRYSDQTPQWAGLCVADILGRDPEKDRKQIRKMIETWLRTGALIKTTIPGPNRRDIPILDVGEWATA